MMAAPSETTSQEKPEKQLQDKTPGKEKTSSEVVASSSSSASHSPSCSLNNTINTTSSNSSSPVRDVHIQDSIVNCPLPLNLLERRGSSSFFGDQSLGQQSVNESSLVKPSPQLHLHSNLHGTFIAQQQQAIIHPQLQQQEDFLIEKNKKKNLILHSSSDSPASSCPSPFAPYHSPPSSSLFPCHHPGPQLNLNPPSSLHHHHQLPNSHYHPEQYQNLRNNLFPPPSPTISFRETNHQRNLPPSFNNWCNFVPPSSGRRCGSVASFHHLPSYSNKKTWLMDQQQQHLHPNDSPSSNVGRGITGVGGYYGPAAYPSSSIQQRDWNNRWETNTAITANTSLHSGSIDLDMNLVGKNSPSGSSSKGFFCPYDELAIKFRMNSGFIASCVVSVIAFFSPIFMIILPRVNSMKWNVSVPGPESDGILISFVFKLLLLLSASWLLFVRRPRAYFPRILIYRAVILALVLILVLSYWLFYVVRASERRLADYDLPFRDLLLSYPVPLLENLLWVHYLAVILMEIRHSRQEYYIKIIRSPDGVAKTYTIGSLSIQRTALWVLEKYYTDFPIYNPHLEVVVSSKRKASKNERINESMTATQGTPGNQGVIELNGGVKYYDVDSMNMMNHNQQQNQIQHNMISTPNTSNPNGNLLQGNGILGGNVGVVMPSSPRSTRGLLNQSGNNTSAGNSIYSLTRNNQSNHLGSKKSHSVVGVETSSRRTRSSSRSSHHHHRSSTSKEREKDRDHHHHNRDRSRDRERDRDRDRDHDRLAEEFEFERKVKKRRARLISSAEEAFTHVKLVGEGDSQGKSTFLSYYSFPFYSFPLCSLLFHLHVISFHPLNVHFKLL